MTQFIYGIHPVEEALKSSVLAIEKILIGSHKASPPVQFILRQAAEKRIPVTFVPGEVIDRMAKGEVHQGVIALIKEASYADLQDILSNWRSSAAKALFLILDSIQDPQNLGSMIRTGLGCGAHGVIIPKDRAVGITPAVIKASAGAIAHIPIARVVNLASTIDTLKREGVWIYGAAGEAGDAIYDLDLNTDLAIVIGSEGKGIRPLVKKKCDRLFSIPMRGPVSSFNAAVSAGMALYETMRQRHLAEQET